MFTREKCPLTRWRSVGGFSLCYSARLCLAGVLLFLLGSAGCRKPPPADILFRYRFRPGEELVYEVSLRGGGEALLTMSGSDDREDRIALPLRLEGGYRMDVRVEAVSPQGEAELIVSYRDFNLAAISRVRDREITATLTDRGLAIIEGEEISKETGPEAEDFPLRGIIGESFLLGIDSRGTILRAEIPPEPERIFPPLQLNSVLERLQPEFPQLAVPVGAVWSRTVEVPAPGLGRHWDRGESWSVELESTFSGFAGPGQRVARIDFSGSYRQEEPGAEGAPETGVRGSFHQLTGTVEFDLISGRILSSHSTLRQNLDLRMASQEALRGREIDIHVDDTLEVTVRLKQ